MRFGLVFLLLLSCLYFGSLQSQEFDLILEHGKVVDGTGNPWKRTDIGIKGNTIEAIGDLNAFRAKQRIDVSNYVVCPGFIDVHSHVEGSLEHRPDAKNFVFDGVTTLVTGNCGSSRPDLKSYFNYLSELNIGINLASLIGHNTIRRTILGNQDRMPNPEEMRKMKMMVSKAMLDGALGLSTGLIYLPGAFAKTDEIVELAREVRQYGGVYVSHIRHEDDRVFSAVKEAAAIGLQAKIPVQISHFKITGKRNWGRSIELIQLIEDYRSRGLDITVDQYPYTASSTRLDVLLPEWSREGNLDDIRQRLAEPKVRKRVALEMRALLDQMKFKNYGFAVVANCSWDSSLNGLSITEINKKWGKTSKLKNEIETILAMMEKGRTQMIYHKMNESDVVKIMQCPFTMIASDAGIPAFEIGVPHPRAYGTNARVLGFYTQKQGVLSLEDAIRKMTSFPAQKFNLRQRGLLKKGMIADIVVFSPDTFIDQATFRQPHQYSTGIIHVLIDGQFTIKEGRMTGIRSGQILKGAPYEN